MDCQEWKDKDLSEGYKHFVDTLHKVNLRAMVLVQVQ